MVAYLPLPDIDHGEFIDQLIAERQQGRHAAYFRDIGAAWKVRIQEYLAGQGNPERFQPWPVVTAEYRKTFGNLYSQPATDSVQQRAFKQIKSPALQFCPACGEDGAPNTLDHYLPKSSYPEFSVVPANLLPMCDACQSKKGVKTVNANNERLFLHPYFDGFAGTQIVELVIAPPFTSPAICLQPRASLGCAESALVARHLAGLDIDRRYSHFFRDEYTRLRKLVAEVRRDQQNLRQLLGWSCRMAGSKSPNVWGHILYASVLANPALMEFLEHGELPAYL